MPDVSGTVAALGGVGGFATAITLLGPVRALWRKLSLRRRSHRLDHEGRPARVDPSTGRVVEPAQPGIASMISDIHARQAEIGEKVAVLVDNARAIAAVHHLIEKQALDNERRHAENGKANAENRAEIAGVKVAVSEVAQQATAAAMQARDAAGHVARIDRQQQENRKR